MARILVVDDQETVRDLCARMLSVRGHTSIQAEGGLDAVRQYALAQPDAVLLDVMMPGMDGLATLAELRKIDPEVKVAMLTSTSERGTVMRALQLGARDYILKPFHGRRLAEAVEKLVATEQ